MRSNKSSVSESFCPVGFIITSSDLVNCTLCLIPPVWLYLDGPQIPHSMRQLSPTRCADYFISPSTLLRLNCHPRWSSSRPLKIQQKKTCKRKCTQWNNLIQTIPKNKLFASHYPQGSTNYSLHKFIKKRILAFTGNISRQRTITWSCLAFCSGYFKKKKNLLAGELFFSRI